MTEKDFILEESLGGEDAGWEVVEVPLDERPLFYCALFLLTVGVIVGGRVVAFGFGNADFYEKRAEANMLQSERVPAPRGIILDRVGEALAENKPAFAVFLDLKEFLRNPDLQDKTVEAVRGVLGISYDDLKRLIEEREVEEFPEVVLLDNDIEQSKLVALRSIDLPALTIKEDFVRSYPHGLAFASVLGYTGLAGAKDVKEKPSVSGQDFLGKSGIEAFYDDALRGVAGKILRPRNARGELFGEEKRVEPKGGQSLTLTIDKDFQLYFFERFSEGLRTLGRTTGVGLALNPQNGEVLALLNFPAFDNNIFGSPASSDARKKLLNSPLKPLFNRAISGLYTPGSTVKPLHAIAALAEGVVTPQKTVFSPGYLDIPNPYDPEKPTRYLDWRYQGEVNLASAIAQSSNVYFYAVGGGAFDVKGLGITRLREWWERFKFGQFTDIDLPHEARGFLPSIEWKEKTTGRPWLLGDTYNVSIGQGDLLVTPLQLLNYIAAIANGGRIYQPVVNRDIPHPNLLGSLSFLEPHIREAQKGMARVVQSSLGTAHVMSDLPFAVAGKTGSAQVRNNEQENAFFVGYLPADSAFVAKTTSAKEAASAKAGAPDANTGAQIAILVLVENSREGSLNAVPIAKDVLAWYYEHRLRVK